MYDSIWDKQHEECGVIGILTKRWIYRDICTGAYLLSSTAVRKAAALH